MAVDEQPKKSKAEIEAIIREIKFMDREFIISTMGDGFYLQMTYFEMDVDTGKLELQKTRKWYISPYATTSEIAQTAFKCVITSQEHIAREHFTYKGERVYGPHLDVEELVALHKAKKLRFDVRIPPKPENDPRLLAKFPVDDITFIYAPGTK